MLLTKKTGAPQSGARSPFVHSLHRGLSQALPTMDRRAFLRRSGLGVGAGIAASSLTLVKKAQAGAAGGPLAAGEDPVHEEAGQHRRERDERHDRGDRGYRARRARVDVDGRPHRRFLPATNGP